MRFVARIGVMGMLAAAACMTGCTNAQREHAPLALGMVMADRDAATVQEIERFGATGDQPAGTKVHLKYENSADVKMRFSGDKFKVENMRGKEEPGSGVSIEDGSVRVDASGTNVQVSAPRFWPIIRRQRVSVGAEGTAFVVEAVNQPAGADGRTLVMRVQFISGTKVMIDAPGATGELTKPGSQAQVYQRRDGNHDIEYAAVASLQGATNEVGE